MRISYVVLNALENISRNKNENEKKKEKSPAFIFSDVYCTIYYTFKSI